MDNIGKDTRIFKDKQDKKRKAVHEERVKLFIDDLRLYLRHQFATEDEGWPEYSPANLADLYGMLRRLIDLKFEKNYTDDSSIQLIVNDLTRFEPIKAIMQPRINKLLDGEMCIESLLKALRSQEHLSIDAASVLQSLQTNLKLIELRLKEHNDISACGACNKTVD